MEIKLRKVLSGVLSIVLATAAISCSSRSGENVRISQSEVEGEGSTEIVWPESFGLGRAASQNEIDSQSIAIPPSGVGLPAGDGLVLRGKVTYLQKCAACHGPTGKEGPEDVLVATEPIFSDGERVSKAIGNYWPYSTTVFDYLRRAMPLNAPGSLSNQEVYDLTAWLLHQNGLIAENFILNSQTLPAIQMPAKIYFTNDTRTGGANPVY